METNENCLIGNINKVIYHNGRYFLLDQIQACIFIFSEEGKHLSTIHKVGTGPNEYVNITDFDVDGSDNVYVGSGNSRKIIKYLFPAYNEAVERSFPHAFLEFAVDNTTGKIWIANILDYNGCIPLSLFADNNQLQTKLSPQKFLDNVERPFKVQSFYKSGDDLYFNPRYSPYIYLIKDEDVIPVFQMESDNFVSEKNFPDNPRKASTPTIVYGVKSFYKINGTFYGERWSSAMGFPFFKYDMENLTGNLIDPLSSGIRHFSGIRAVTSDAIIIEMPADFLNKKDSNSTELNPYLVKIKIH
ncbi:hypothetical protein AGMMS50239_40330 [Bacteroidia bacterium]|nr:hypothetical protein AGMMS50239_40330 [Bacteroidia bacterium]